MRTTVMASAITLIFLLCFSKTDVIRVKATYQSTYCQDPEVKIKDMDNDLYWNYEVLKEGPNFVLDYFQDPDGTGVDITVSIRSTELVATYWYPEDVCTGFDTRQTGKTSCIPEGRREPGIYYYYQSQCISHSETTYRTIETGSISIWLEPTPQTMDLLGPGPYMPDSKTPVLRYLYPDQWALLVVNPGDMTIVEKSWFKDPEDVIAFLEKNKEYVILESDAKDYELTSRLAKTHSPVTTRGALGLMYLGNCWAEISKISHKVCFPEEGEWFQYGVIDYTVKMKRIPIDVPGTWYVGVSFYLWPAKFDNGRSEEDLGTGEYRQFVFPEELAERKFSFESYILRSAPCNPQEPGGCWEVTDGGGE